jgi:hypothetical protein
MKSAVENRGPRRKMKKKEFPGFMENMPPGNSFPQICVVSVYKSVRKRCLRQEYLRIGTKSNDNVNL